MSRKMLQNIIIGSHMEHKALKVRNKHVFALESPIFEKLTRINRNKDGNFCNHK